jgi:hypothetical protein
MDAAPEHLVAMKTQNYGSVVGAKRREGGRWDIRSSPRFLPHLKYSWHPVLESSYLHASLYVIVFATHPPADYCVLTPGRKSAWGVLSLGRTDVGE